MVISVRKLRDQMIASLRNGKNAYTESDELIRLLQRDILKENLDVIFDRTSSGCWFIPAEKASADKLKP